MVSSSLQAKSKHSFLSLSSSSYASRVGASIDRASRRSHALALDPDLLPESVVEHDFDHDDLVVYNGLTDCVPQSDARTRSVSRDFRLFDRETPVKTNGDGRVRSFAPSGSFVSMSPERAMDPTLELEESTLVWTREWMKRASFQAYTVTLDATERGGLGVNELRCLAVPEAGTSAAAVEMEGASRVQTARRLFESSTREQKIDEIWAKKVEANGALFNGTKFRYASCAFGDASGRDGAGEAVIVLWLGLTDYKTFLGTNCADDWEVLMRCNADETANVDEDVDEETRGRIRRRDDVERYAHYADALGNCVALRTADDKFICLHRSDKVGEAPNAIVFPGGHGEPSEVGFDKSSETVLDVSDHMFDSALHELEEELGVPRADVSYFTCLGITRRVVNARSCMIFYAETQLTSAQVLNLYPSAAHGFESSKAIALRFEDFDTASMPGDHVGAVHLLARFRSTRRR